MSNERRKRGKIFRPEVSLTNKLKIVNGILCWTYFSNWPSKLAKSMPQVLHKISIIWRTICEILSSFSMPLIVHIFVGHLNNPFPALLLPSNSPWWSKCSIPCHYCSWFNYASIFKERRMRRNKLPAVAGYSAVKLFWTFLVRT